jgi:hypothetical protein
MVKKPCSDCIIRCNCSEMCDKPRRRGLFSEILVTRSCPDCGGDYIDIRKLLTNFYVIYCTDCNSKFTIDTHHFSIDIKRSTIAKGSLILDAKYRPVMELKEYKSILIDKFINDIQEGRYG